MIGGSFINRIPELEEFNQQIATTPPSRNRIIFLTAPTAFGKSEFTEKLIAEQSAGVGVKVRIPANGSAEAIFIRALAAELDFVARKRRVIPTCDEFLRTLPSRRSRQPHDRALLGDLSSLTPAGLGRAALRITDRTMNTGEYDCDRLLHDTNVDSTIKLFDYARFVFDAFRMCAAFENIQAIDDASERMLSQLLFDQRGHFVVFEYTLQAPSGRELGDLVRTFKKGDCEVRETVLRRLPVSEILQTFSDAGRESQAEIFANFDGNLRKVQDFVLSTTRDVFLAGATVAGRLSYDESTKRLITSLRPASQFVLALVATHRSSVSHDSLLSLSLDSPYFRSVHVDIDDALAELESDEFDLVRAHGARVELTHDFIAAEVARGFSKYVDLANHAWATHYRRRLDTADFGESGKDEVLDYLFSFYLRTDPPKLQPLMSEIRHVVMSSFSTRRAETVLDSIEESLRGQTPSFAYEESLRWQLLEIYYEAGLYDRALTAIDLLRTNSPRLTVYRAAVLDRLDRHAEAIDLIRRTLAVRPIRHDSFELSLRIIEFICWRSLNEYAETSRLYDLIGSISEYRSLTEYGYYLRNSEIVLPIHESIPHLEESVTIFRDAGRSASEAQSRISVAMQLIRLGRLDEAEGELDSAETLLGDRRLEWHVVHNNRAVLLIYRPEFDLSRVDRLLTTALLTATIPFDRISIQNNRLAAHSLAGDFDFCDPIARQLERTAPEQADEVLLCITFFNLSVHYGRVGDTTSAERCVQLARQARNDWPAYWNCRFEGTPIPGDPAAEYLAAFAFDPVLLSAWHIEISDFSEHYEPGLPA